MSLGEKLINCDSEKELKKVLEKAGKKIDRTEIEALISGVFTLVEDQVLEGVSGGVSLSGAKDSIKQKWDGLSEKTKGILEGMGITVGVLAALVAGNKGMEKIGKLYTEYKFSKKMGEFYPKYKDNKKNNLNVFDGFDE